MKKNNIYLFLIALALFIAAVVVFYESYFSKKKQLDKNESVNKGYGYYSQEVSLGCKTTTCSEEGEETFVQKCIINKRTGKYCITPEGEYSSKSVVRTQPCRIQCYSDQLAMYTGYETEVSKSVGIDNSITEYRTIKPNSGNIKLADENTGVDFTNYFLKPEGGTPTNPKYSLKRNCIPNNIIPYQINTIHSQSNSTEGTNETIINCNNFNDSNTLRFTGNLFNNYPEESNINGTGSRKVCYDINNTNRLEFLNSATEITEEYQYPDECYKHSLYKNIDTNFKLWPDSDSSNNFKIISNFKQDSEYFSITNSDDINNFSSVVENIVNPDYTIQGDTNFYCKVMLNNEITLLDNIYSISTNNLSTENLDNFYFYLKGSSLSVDPGISNNASYCPGTPGSFGGNLSLKPLPETASGTCYFYPFFISNITLVEVNNTNDDRIFYYFNKEGQEYIYFKNSNDRVIDLSDSDILYIDDKNFSGVPFRLLENLSQSENDRFIGVSLLPGFSISPFLINENINISNNISNYGSSGYFSSFKKLYKKSDLSSLPNSEILFTNNCSIYGDDDLTLEIVSNSLKSEEEEYQIKANDFRENYTFNDKNNYVYGNVEETGGTFYYPVIGICGSSQATGSNILNLKEYPGINFITENMETSNYTVPGNFKNALEEFGIGSGIINRRKSTNYNYPSNLEINCKGNDYSNLDRSFTLFKPFTRNNGANSLISNIGCRVNNLDLTPTLNVKLLRSNNIIVTPEMQYQNYKEKKLKEYYTMIMNQTPTSQNINSYSFLTFFPQMSVSKVLDFGIFKSPYNIVNGERNYICFDEKNNFLTGKKINVKETGEIINNISVLNFEDYLVNENKNYGCCYNSVGIRNEDKLIKPTEFREKQGININDSCTSDDIVKTNNYSTIDSYLEPCLQSRELERYNENEKDLDNFFTRDVDENKIYSIDEDLMTNYENKDYYLNSSNNLKLRTSFFQNSINLVKGQLITEIFDNYHEPNNDFNNGLGTSDIYLQTNYSENFNKKITYEVTKSGFIPMSPSNIAVNFFYGKRTRPFTENSVVSVTKEIDYEQVTETYSSSLERNDNYIKTGNLLPGTSYGNWIERKFDNFPGISANNISSPYLIQFGLVPKETTDTYQINIFKSRFYDTTIGDPGNNLQVGDYISPDFTYFNKFFAPIFNSNSTSAGISRALINDLLIKLDTPVLDIGTSILTDSSGEFSKISPNDYFLFTSAPLGGLSGTCYYPTLEIGKALKVFNSGTSLMVERNVNNVNTTFLPKGYNDLLFVLGNNNSNVPNSIINNYYQITKIGTSNIISDRYLEFEFQIPSMIQGNNNQLLYGTSTSNSDLGNFIKLISGTDEDFQTESGSSIYDKLTPALSAKFIKNSVTFPSSGNAFLFSNYENPKITTKLSSYITDYKIEDTTTIYLNEFREDLNLLDKQERLTFDVGDTIKYYTRENYSEELDPTIQNFKQHQFVIDLTVVSKNCVVSTGVSSFKIYDYKCESSETIILPGFNYNSNLGTSSFYEVNSIDYSIPYFFYNSSSQEIENLKGISSFDFNLGLSVSFYNGKAGVSLGEKTFLDYYKLNNLPFNSLGFNAQNKNNFPYHSYFIRSGILDMVTLNSTILTNTEDSQITIPITNITSDLKPYGNSYFISTPESEKTRVNYNGYGTVTNFDIINGTEGVPPGIYTSDKGIEIKIPETSFSLAELQLKSIEDYSPTVISEIPTDTETERLNWTNSNIPQFFKNISSSGASFSQGDNTSWETIPYSFYPTQNFIIGKIGNIYYKGDILLHDISQNLFQVIPNLIKLEDNWWLNENSKLNPVTYNNTLSFSSFNPITGSKENFYTFVESNGISGFLQNPNSIEMVGNLNNQNFPLLIKKYDDSLGNCPESGTYFSKNYEIAIDSSFIKNTVFNNVLDIFKNKLSLGKIGNNILSLGFTPVSESNPKIDNLIFLQDNFDRNTKISQYIYSVDLNPLDYGKDFCVGLSTFTIGGITNNIDKFEFSNSILFNILPNSLDTQDHIPYLGVSTFNGTSIISFQENNFPIQENYFPGASGVFNSGVSRFILDSEGVSSSQGVSFSQNFIKFKSEANSSSIKINQEYDLYSYAGSGISTRMTIKELGYNLFSLDSMIGGSISINSTGNFTYGDYWYVHDNKNNIATFGYISPDENLNVNYNSFISLKEIKEPLDENDTIKLITQDSGASVTNLNSFLNRNGELLNIKNYEIENSYGTLNQYYRAFTPGYTFFPFHIYLNFYDNGTGTSGVLKYDQAIVHGYDKTITGTSQIYLPIEEDFYNYIKCRGIGCFGSNSVGKIKYSPVENERVISSDGTSYTPLIFEPYKISTFVNNTIKNTTTLATGKGTKIVSNVQDCFIFSLDSDNNINFKSNPFTDSIKNSFCNFVPSSLNSNRTYRNLGVIDSQSTEVLSTESLSGVSFQQSGMSPVNISNINEIYTPGVCVPGLVNFYLNYQEIRQNLKTYFQEKKNNCSVFYDLITYHVPSNIGGQLNFNFENNKFNINPVSDTNHIYSTGENITIGKNLIYSVNSTEKKIFFSTKQDKLEYKSENFESGTSALQVNFFSDTSYYTEISESEYLQNKNGTIRLIFRDNYEDLNNYKIYSGYLDTSNNNRFVQTNGVSVIQNTYS